MSASPNGPCPYLGEPSVTVYSSSNSVTSHFLLHIFFSRPTFFHSRHSLTSSLCSGTPWHHPRPPLHSRSPGHHIPSPCGISFLGHPICMHRSTLGHPQ